MDIDEFINGEKPLSVLSQLLELPGTQVFFKTEHAVINGLPLNRRSAERLMEYAVGSRSIAAWETLIKKFWGMLSDDEQRDMKSAAYDTLDKNMVDEWFEIAEKG